MSSYINGIVFGIYKPYLVWHLTAMGVLGKLVYHSADSILYQLPVFLVVNGELLFSLPAALFFLLPKVQTDLFPPIAFQKNDRGPPAETFIYSLLTHDLQG